MVTNRESLIGKILYGALFVIVIPAALVSWAILLDPAIPWVVPDWQIPGAIVAGIGLVLMLMAMWALIVQGHGLPMNAYPPRDFVSTGIYSLFSHPIYLGAVLIALGVSLWFQSAPGLFVVTPTLGLMIVSLIYGYERPAMLRLFGDSARGHHPLFALPPADDAPATWPRKLAMIARFAVPWYLAAILIDFARCGESCRILTDPVSWALPAFNLISGSVAAMSNGRLREMAISALLWSVLSIFVNLVAPLPATDDLITVAITGVINVIIAFAASLHRPIWNWLRALTERVANSRRDWLFFDGRLRIISHSLFSFAMGAIGAAVACVVIGNNVAVILSIACAVIGGALYAQLSWGSSSLLRPFGFWGGVLGMFVGVTLAQVLLGVPAVQTLLGAVVAAPFAQAAGRLRCLAQGCCHGVVTSEALGIRVWQPQSRVVVLSKLAGQPILPTQLFSILFNLLLGPLLVAMWLSGSLPSTAIIGAYFLLTGIERFAEDAYRGETQTRTILGLKEPQWLALASVLGGIAATILPSHPSNPAAPNIDTLMIITILAGGLITAFAMSIDFPKSTARFSRLSG